MENKCGCCSGEKMVVSCSGAADVGLLSDQVARSLSKNNRRKMSCLALFAVCGDEKINEFKSNDILVIDGCNVDCGRKVMENRNIEDYIHLRITDLGYKKGETPSNSEVINAVYKKAEVL